MLWKARLQSHLGEGVTVYLRGGHVLSGKLGGDEPQWGHFFVYDWRYDTQPPDEAGKWTYFQAEDVIALQVNAKRK